MGVAGAMVAGAFEGFCHCRCRLHEEKEKEIEKCTWRVVNRSTDVESELEILEIVRRLKMNLNNDDFIEKDR